MDDKWWTNRILTGAIIGNKSSESCWNLSIEYSWTISPKHFNAALLYVGFSFLHSLNIESSTYRRSTILTLKIGSETSVKKFEDQPHDKTFIPASYSSVTARPVKLFCFNSRRWFQNFWKLYNKTTSLRHKMKWLGCHKLLHYSLYFNFKIWLRAR